MICGFSMGGYVALNFAARYAGRLRGLVLIDTKADADSEEARKGRYALAERAKAEGKGVVIEAMMPRLVSDSTFQGRPDVVQEVLDAEAPATLDGIVGALHAMAERRSSLDMLHAIAVPTLIMVGAEDAITPLTDAEKMCLAIPNAVLTIVPDAGHITPIEQPNLVNEAVLRFLDALP